ncbi:GATA transcription factor [Vigna angularis]|uniref:GATA transcription factor n=1 Tax=Phaseolus angularis TaxID=3914 RepID=A0A8T0KJZ1_PHAAN|nr:GATA transcription factor [Vigna angularis]
MASLNPQPLQFQHPAIPVGDDGDSDAADDDAMDELEDAHVTSVNVVANAASAYQEPLPAMPSRTSELTLSFEGEVQAVLLLLGGRDVHAGVPAVELPFDQSNRGMGDTPKLSNLSRRIASLVRFREKRKERCFDKKIRYTVRKEVAQRMHRKNGQFASLKESPGSSNWDSARNADVTIVVSLKIILLQCVGGQLDQGLYVMHAALCGQTRLSLVVIKCLGTLRDLSKGGRNLSVVEQSDLDIPIDVKPTSVIERELSGIHDEQGSSEDPSKSNTGDGSSGHAVNPSDEELPETADHFTNAPPLVGLVHSSRNDTEQEPLVELSNPSDTDIDIPGNFD